MSEALSPTAPHSATTLEDRYGSRRRASLDRRFGWGAAIALLLAGVAFLLWSGWQETGQVEVQNIGFTQVNDLELTVKFGVTGPPNTPVACAIEALSTSKGTVGWNIVEVPVGEQRSHTVTTSLRLVAPATAAEAKECWVIQE